MSPLRLGNAQSVAASYTPLFRALAEARVAPLGSALGAVSRSLGGVDALEVNAASKRIADAVARWERHLFPVLAAIGKNFLGAVFPANLREIDGVDLTAVLDAGRHEGIALYGVPRASTAQSILSAGDPQARRAVFGRKFDSIAADDLSALETISAPQVAVHASMLRSAIEAAQAGHTRAAQALATCVLDAAVFDLVEADISAYARARKRDPERRAEAELTLRDALVILPLIHAFVVYRRKDGDPVPRTYSRNATVHHPGPRQYSRRNAAQALLLTTSVLLYADELRTGRKR